MEYNKIVKSETGDDQNTSVTDNSGHKNDVQNPNRDDRIGRELSKICWGLRWDGSKTYI